MVGGSQTSRGVLVHKSEGVIDNIHLLNVAKYPKKLIADEPQIPQDSNNVVLLANKLWNQLQNYYTEIINKTVIFDLPAF